MALKGQQTGIKMVILDLVGGIKNGFLYTQLLIMIAICLRPILGYISLFLDSDFLANLICTVFVLFILAKLFQYGNSAVWY